MHHNSLMLCTLFECMRYMSSAGFQVTSLIHSLSAVCPYTHVVSSHTCGKASLTGQCFHSYVPYATCRSRMMVVSYDDDDDKFSSDGYTCTHGLEALTKHASTNTQVRMYVNAILHKCACTCDSLSIASDVLPCHLCSGLTSRR